MLGSIESGVDFEKRIAEIYQTCRTPEEIQQSFDTLQAELSSQISENMRSTRQKLLENFDAEVAEKLNVYKAEATASLNRYEALLWKTTRHALEGYASFDDKALTFRLNRVPENGIPPGVYTLKRARAARAPLPVATSAGKVGVGKHQPQESPSRRALLRLFRQLQKHFHLKETRRQIGNTYCCLHDSKSAGS